MDDWRIAAELALRFDVDFDLESVDEVQTEIARAARAYRGVDPHVIRGARDGVVVPMTEVPVLVSGPRVGADVTNVDVSTPQTGIADAEAGHGDPVPMDSADTAESDLPPGDEGPETAPVAPPSPDLYRWTPAGADAPAAPPDGYALRLVVGRKLYDGGLVVSHGPSIAHLAPGAALHLNPIDQERLGVADGGTVRVASQRGSVVMAVRASTAVPKGVAYLPHRQPGGDVDLVDTAQPVTDLRVETVR
jgi:predicted molibdopterin-dependent oxidoreductase YjgC